MGWWSRFKSDYHRLYAEKEEAARYSKELQRRNLPPDHYEQKYRREKRHRRHDERRHREDNRLTYGYGYEHGRHVEREVRAAYDEGWQERGMHEQYAREERRYQRQLAQERAYLQQEYEYVDYYDDPYGRGGHGHSGRRHGGHRSGRHSKQRAPSPANHGKRITWEKEDRRTWHG